MNDEEHSLILKSIADETRLRMLRLLKKEELNVQEICENSANAAAKNQPSSGNSQASRSCQ